MEQKKNNSYKWVEKEIKQYFPKANILVLSPTPKSNLNNLANDIINFINSINDKVLLFATTDLTHYGARFNNINLLKYPQELNKWKREENLIDKILNINLNLDKKDLEIMCGSWAIQTFMYVVSNFNWNSRVVEYYDSYGIEKELFIDRYTIDFENKQKNFVSYISIIFGNFKNFKNELLPIDLYMGFGLLKSIIKSKLYKYYNNDNLKLPKWNIFNKIKNGIFVGTELKNETNCSYGNYQQSNTNSAINISNASKYCYDDANYRWKIPYKKENINKLILKIEILDDVNTWKKYKSNKAHKKFKFDGNHGMLLEFKNNSATFLPVVARNYKNKWNINKYMEHLSLKAGGHKNDWKNNESIMKIYKSKFYKYNQILNKIYTKDIEKFNNFSNCNNCNIFNTYKKCRYNIQGKFICINTNI